MSDRRPRKRYQHSNLRPSIDELKSAARGRWLEILTDAGLSTELLDGRGHACPRCGGHDRFASWPDVAQRGAVHCRHCFTRGSSPKPGDGVSTLCWLLECNTADACRWLADWLGITERPQRRTPSIVRAIRLESQAARLPESFDGLANRCYRAMRGSWWERLADRLNLPAVVLMRFRVGWYAEANATTWPMIDASGKVIGIRLRCMTTNRKWAIRGGRAGLFVPDGLPRSIDRLWITEGPTDAAAMLSLGLDAIGRASCTGSVSLECQTVRRWKPSESVIVADRDEVGRRGAESLAVPLLTCCRSVRIITPPHSFGDVREWVAAGATSGDIIAAADAAKPRMLNVKSGVKS